MLCLDVNVLVLAHRVDAADHDEYRRVLTSVANGSEPVGLPDVCLSGFVRIMTNSRAFNDPIAPSEAWADVERLLRAPSSRLLTPGVRHWSAFRSLAEQIGARGNDVTDAYIAAYAVENNATLLSADRGFARFETLRWRHPLTH